MGRVMGLSGMSPDGRAMGSGGSLPSRTKTGGGEAGLGWEVLRSLGSLILNQIACPGLPCSVNPTRLQGQEDILWERCFWGLGFLPFARVAVGWEWFQLGICSSCAHSLGQVLCGPGPGRQAQLSLETKGMCWLLLRCEAFS